MWLLLLQNTEICIIWTVLVPTYQWRRTIPPWNVQVLSEQRRASDIEDIDILEQEVWNEVDGFDYEQRNKGTTGWWIWLWIKEGIKFLWVTCWWQSTLTFLKTGGERSDKLLGIIHSDVCAKISTKSLSGAEYFVTFIDDKSRFVWVYTLKSEVKWSLWKVYCMEINGGKI